MPPSSPPPMTSHAPPHCIRLNLLSPRQGQNRGGGAAVGGMVIRVAAWSSRACSITGTRMAGSIGSSDARISRIAARSIPPASAGSGSRTMPIAAVSASSRWAAIQGCAPAARPRQPGSRGRPRRRGLGRCRRGHPRLEPAPGVGVGVAEEPHRPVAVLIDTQTSHHQLVHLRQHHRPPAPAAAGWWSGRMPAPRRWPPKTSDAHTAPRHKTSAAWPTARSRDRPRPRHGPAAAEQSEPDARSPRSPDSPAQRWSGPSPSECRRARQPRRRRVLGQVEDDARSIALRARRLDHGS